MGQFESFKSEQELVGRIERLRADGVHDNDITVFSKEALEGTSLNYTGVNFKNADGSPWDRFISLFTSEAPEERALADLELNESEKEDYITSLQAGDILLHVNNVALGESDKMGSDEEETSRYDSGDNNVGGEPHEKQGVGEEENPGVAGTAAADTESTGSARAALDRNYEAREVDSINELDDTEENSGRVVDEELNIEYGTDEATDPENKAFEGTMRAEDRDLGTSNDNKENSGRVVDEEPNIEYGTDEATDPENKAFEGTMRAEDRESNVNETSEKVDVSSYGYDEKENINPIDAEDEDDIEKKKAALDQQYYSDKNDGTKNEPDRRNFNI